MACPLLSLNGVYLIKHIILLLLFVSLVWSHPHTFIDLYPTLHVKNNTIIKTHIKWKMDDMTSSMLIMEFDLNADGAIDKKENTFVYKNYFLSLEQNNYYMDILVEDQSIPLSSISNFKASIEDNRLCYSFDIIQNLDIKKTKFEFYDKDLFVAFMLKKEFVTAENKKVKIIGIDKDFYYINRLEIE